MAKKKTKKQSGLGKYFLTATEIEEQMQARLIRLAVAGGANYLADMGIEKLKEGVASGSNEFLQKITGPFAQTTKSAVGAALALTGRDPLIEAAGYGMFAGGFSQAMDEIGLRGVMPNNIADIQIIEDAQVMPDEQKALEELSEQFDQMIDQKNPVPEVNTPEDNIAEKLI